MSSCQNLDLRFCTEKKVEIDRSLTEVLDEAARIVIERCEKAAAGIPFVEKDLAIKLAGAAAGVFSQAVISHYAKDKSVRVDGFKEET